MNKKLFALIIAASMLALPITAQEDEKTLSADYKKSILFNIAKVNL